MKLFYALALSIVILFAAGCSKSSDSPSSGAQAILTSGKWQLTGGSVTLSYPGIPNTTENVQDITPSCVWDNYTIFNAGGTASVEEGATKCDASDPQVDNNAGNWKLLENNTKLQANDPASGFVITADILQLDDNTLKIQFAIANQGATANTIEIFKHIK